VTRATDSGLVSAVAHELRTPVAAVRNAAEALRQTPDDAARERLLGVIVGASDQLGRLVDDLLDAARLGSGRFEVRLTSCDPAAIVVEAAQAVELATGAGGTIAVDTHGAPAVLADPDRLRQIVTNLLENAISHGGGRAAVSIAVTGSGSVQVSVTDAGPGIPAGERDRVFEPFHRLAGGSVRGTGLGLHLARELALAMGGTLTVGDSPAPGATFALELRAG
jgi:signal transduction histidine kinase